MTWYGHLLRLPEDTPARKSLKEAKNPCKKPRGGRKLTWIKQIEKDLEKVEFKILVKNNKDGSFNTIQVKEYERWHKIDIFGDLLWTAQCRCRRKA